MKNKIIFLFVLLLTFLCACVFWGCSSDNKSGSGGGENEGGNVPVVNSYKQILNDFEHYDDLKKFAIDAKGKTNLDGSIKVNNDDRYIKSGAASMAVTFNGISETTFPYLPVYARSLGLTDISFVEKFGIYIYNPSGYTFRFGLAAKKDNGEYLYNKLVEVSAGANEIEFETERSLLQYVAKSVSSFDLQFVGVRAGMTVYLDDFYAITASEQAEPIKEIEDMLSEISKLDANNKTEVFGLYEKYKSLKGEYKVAVSNYPLLKAAVDAFYINDVAAARTANPNTVLFFNEPFGEFQISGTATNITTCDYSTEWAIKDESGSLKVSFMDSNITWCGIETTATIDIDNPYIYFTVFNDSDQRKMLALNWEGNWILPARSELLIRCPSTYLTQEQIPGTTAHRAGGDIQFCGLAADTVVPAATEGTIYISSIRSYDPITEIKVLRQGEDSNTLFFFDSEAGQKMILTSSEGVADSYSEEMAYGNEAGSLQLTFNNSATTQETVSYLTAEYQLSENDYVYFHVYNDTAFAVQLMLEYSDGVRLNPRLWTDVLIPAKEFETISNFRIWSVNYSKLAGHIYFSKAKVVSGDSIVNLADKEENTIWSFGGLTLFGPLQYDNLKTHPSQTLTNPLGYAPYLYNDEILINYMEYPYGRIRLSLKDAIALTEDVYIELTVRTDGRLDENMILNLYNENDLIWDESGTIPYHYILSDEKRDLGNGYTKYLFRIPAVISECIKSIEIQSIENMGLEEVMQFVLKDIQVYTFAETQAAGWAKNA